MSEKGRMPPVSIECRLTNSYRHIIHVHVRVVRSASRILVVSELDADGLTGVGRKIEGHLYPDPVVGGVHEQLLQHIAAAIDHVSLLPAVGTRIVTGGPVVEAQVRVGRITGDGNHLGSDTITRLITAPAQLQ